MPYIYRLTRRDRSNRQPETAGGPVSGDENPSLAEAQVKAGSGTTYRDLQAQAKALGISGRQKAGKLRKAIAEATK